MSFLPAAIRSAIALVCTLVFARQAASAEPAVDFEKAVAPIFIRNCVSCHNAGERKGGLDLTRAEGLAKGGDSGPVVVAGDVDSSYLIERVAEGSMPPKKAGPPLTKEEIAALTAWVASGAKWPEKRVLSSFELTTSRRAGYDWWSLQPLANTGPPAIHPIEPAQNAIDSFVLARLREQGLSLASPADKRTLLRRAKFDLVGLPPTPDELHAFITDDAPDAYERLLDRLLASPHYGERWGRHWLDVARFGESDGFEQDKARDHAWRYRDYVVSSFNADKPYRQFVLEQLAGDALSPVTRDGIVATGFLVAGPWDEIQNVGKSQAERMRTHEEQLEELLATVSQAFLGLTVNCARCHDHKFDPIPQADYYRIKAVFDGVDHGNRPLLTPEEEKAHAAAQAPLQAKIAELKAEIARLSAAVGGDAVAEKPDAKPLVAGKFGQALDTRRSRATAPAKAIHHTPPLSVECWTKLDSRAGFNVLVSKNLKESSDHWEIYSYAGSGEFSAYLPGFSPGEIKSGHDITDGKWHHVAMNFEPARVRLYVDGRLVKDAAIERKKSGGPEGPLWLGSYAGQIGCDGLIDEVRISRGLREFDRVPEEPPAADEQTIGLWRFDALEGDRLADSAPIPRDSPDRDEAKRRRDMAVVELKTTEEKLASLTPPQTYSGVRRQPEPTVVFLRGDIKNPGERVTAAGLTSVRGLPAELALSSDAPEAERRRRFAEWVASDDNPLTARVIVNRIWQHHFGRGLVETPSDFGFNGGTPSHPELLDWLAREIVASGGSIKHLHRQIMLSAAYRQSAASNSRAAEFDADNRLLWRFAPRRLEAETIRDAMLATSSELNGQIGGPSFRPFTVTVFNTHFYHLFDKGEPQFNRRSIYRMQVNTAKSPLLDALDCPAPSISSPQRRSTTTPLQALALMNDSFVMRQAERFAQRLEREAGTSMEGRIKLAYIYAIGRLPSPAELTATRDLATDHGLAAVCWSLLNASEFLYVK